MAGGLEAAGSNPRIGTEFGVDRDARALGEAGRPVTDGHQLEAAVFLDALDLRAQRIEVRNDGAGAAAAAALTDRPDGAAPGQFGGQAKTLQLLGAVTPRPCLCSRSGCPLEQRLQLGERYSWSIFNLRDFPRVIALQAPFAPISGPKAGRAGR